MTHTAKLLDGKALSEEILADARARAAKVQALRGAAPRLAVVSVGSDPEKSLYIKRKLKAAEAAGLQATLELLPEDATEETLLSTLRNFSGHPHIDGILLEQPLPRGFHLDKALAVILPSKDVEGVTPENYGRFYAAKTLEELEEVFAPCTAWAMILLLRRSGVSPEGREAVVVGRSNIVGRPLAHLLTCLNATVTLCHTRTRDLGAHVLRADILAAATTVPLWLKGSMLKDGAVVLDAGTHWHQNRLVGDADPSCAERAAFLTPVPGGVGPVTVAALLQNVVRAAERR